MDMGSKIHLLRTQNNMTLEELGNKVGVGKSTVRKWENGIIANMKRDKILKVAEALNTSPAYLMGWKEDVEIIPSPDFLPRIMEYYNQLNALGKETATEHVRLLTLDKKYTQATTYEFKPVDSLVAEDSAPYNSAVAAHDDYSNEDGEMERVSNDLKKLKRP